MFALEERSIVVMKDKQIETCFGRGTAARIWSMSSLNGSNMRRSASSSTTNLICFRTRCPLSISAAKRPGVPTAM